MIAIIGAGLIGLSLAYELTRRGTEVRVFDVGEAGGAASWAGAGMLAPDTEAPPSSAMQRLCALSLDRYPAFVEAVRADSGIDPRLHLDGILHIALTANDSERLRARVAASVAEGIPARWLTRGETVALEPSAAGNVIGAALFKREGHVDNRRLGRALRAACERQGVGISAHCGSIAIESDARRVRGLRTTDGFLAADVVVNAAGAWASMIDGLPEHARVPVHPVKGQMLALAMPRGLVRRALWYSDGYVVPRDDGRLLVGATVEDVGFDVRVTADGVRTLLDAVLRALPALRDLALVETWAGLRPGSADGLPYIGFGALGGYAVATGHFRNGILLAPATATMLADIIEGKACVVEPGPFSPQRLADPGNRMTVPA